MVPPIASARNGGGSRGALAVCRRCQRAISRLRLRWLMLPDPFTVQGRIGLSVSCFSFSATMDRSCTRPRAGAWPARTRCGHGRSGHRQEKLHRGRRSARRFRARPYRCRLLRGRSCGNRQPRSRVPVRWTRAAIPTAPFRSRIRPTPRRWTPVRATPAIAQASGLLRLRKVLRLAARSAQTWAAAR